MKYLLIMVLSIASLMDLNAQSKKSLVTYFSCTGTTEKVAKSIAQLVNADVYKIVPQEPYTSADLNWNNSSSRSSVEMKDSKSRPAISNNALNVSAYDTIFIGFPIWWDKAPTIINTFIESHDFSGKTIIPFATSGSSSINGSERSLHNDYPTLNWAKGKLLNGGVSKETLKNWY